MEMAWDFLCFLTPEAGLLTAVIVLKITNKAYLFPNAAGHIDDEDFKRRIRVNRSYPAFECSLVG